MLKAILDELQDELEEMEHELGTLEENLEEARVRKLSTHDIENEIEYRSGEVQELRVKIGEIEEAMDSCDGSLIHERAFKDYAIELHTTRTLNSRAGGTSHEKDTRCRSI